MHKKKKFPYQLFLTLFVVIEIAFYLMSGVCNIPDVTILNLEESILYSFMHPLEAWNDKTVSFLCIGFLVWFAMIAYYMQYHRNFHPDAFGSDEWRDVHEANAYYRDKIPQNNRILTQNLWVSLEKGLSNNNMAVLASSGGYKTTALVEQNLLQFASSYIVLDVKGELRRKWGRPFIEHGYSLKTIDFKNPEKSDQYNPFVNIETEADILRIGASFLDACRPKKEASMQDPFWDDAVMLYSQSIYFAEWLRSRETEKVGTMNGVMELFRMETRKVGADPISGKEITELQVYMDDLAEKYGDDYPPVRDYRKLKGGAPDTVNSVILMVNGMFNVCETAEVRRIFEGNDINIREIGTGVGKDPHKKTVIFLCIPDDNPVYNWIVSVFYTQCTSILSRLADDELCRPLPVRVEFWMDEFYAGCRPADVDKLLGIIRSRNICMILILQSIAQIKELYKGEKWKIIMDNLAVVMYMGSGPLAEETHEYISKALGNQTIDLLSDNAHFGHNANTGVNFSQQKRELMTPTEVKRMSTKDAIVFIEASQPIYDKKAIPFDTKDGEYVAPKWYKDRYFKNLAYGDYEHPVQTYYDPIHFHYITIKKDKPFQVITDKKDIETLQREAMTNKDIYTFTVDKDKLLYLSWGKPAYTQENIEAIYNKIMEDKQLRTERLKGLIVLQNVEGAGLEQFGNTKELTTNKDGWENYKTFKALLENHWDDLSMPEQEEICFAMDEGLTEEQLRMLMLKPLVEMTTLRRAFILENQGKG